MIMITIFSFFAFISSTRFVFLNAFYARFKVNLFKGKMVFKGKNKNKRQKSLKKMSKTCRHEFVGTVFQFDNFKI